jgi:FKBP-type peptidyl-prolyl cis-trans isomerase SlyD
MAARPIRFAYVLKSLSGDVIDVVSREQPLEFQDGSERFIPGLEAVLRSMQPGQRRTARLAAAQAYGERDPSLVQSVPRAQLPPVELEAGAVFRAGEDVHDPIVTIVSIEGDLVTLDANHPLAGLDLIFEIETLPDAGG